jgi:hypothetical protein
MTNETSEISIETNEGIVSFVPQESDYAVIEITQYVRGNGDDCKLYAMNYLDVPEIKQLRNALTQFLEENGND